MTNSEVTDLRAQLQTAQEECQRYNSLPQVKDCFGWLFTWLTAYDKANGTMHGKEITQWISTQPTSR